MTTKKKSPPNAHVDETKLKAEAAEYVSKGKFKKALPLYVQLSTLNPKDLRFKTKVGDLLVKLEQKSEAAQVYRSVAAQYAAQGMLIQAIAMNKIILQLTPEDHSIRQALASLYGRKQEEPSGTVVARVNTVVRPIQIREVPVETAPSTPQGTTYFGGTAVGGALQIQVPVEPILDLDAADEIPGRLIDFSEAIDLGAISELSLPPTPLFSQLDRAALEDVLQRVERREYAQGSIVCKEGDAGDSIYVISEGELQVTTVDTAGQILQLAHLKSGDFFGEFGYFSDRRRHATVTAQTDTVVLELARHSMEQTVRAHPGVETVLQNFYRQRLLETLLAKSCIFSNLSADERRDLAARFAQESHAQGTTLMREGDDGDSMVLIQEGRLSVSTNKDGKRVDLATLKEGDFCGEFSVLTGAKRTADVTTLTPVKLLKLSMQSAREFLGEHTKVFDALRRVADERVAGTIKVLTSEKTGLV